MALFGLVRVRGWQLLYWQLLAGQASFSPDCSGSLWDWHYRVVLLQVEQRPDTHTRHHLGAQTALTGGRRGTATRTNKKSCKNELRTKGVRGLGSTACPRGKGAGRRLRLLFFFSFIIKEVHLDGDALLGLTQLGREVGILLFGSDGRTLADLGVDLKGGGLRHVVVLEANAEDGHLGPLGIFGGGLLGGEDEAAHSGHRAHE
ncbi:hypothetical protein T492DRAFT_396822 [Pavlovales sp. CCMP2436]|nr:hypothetical protein T492DRAFT_396822 [Pavlovales sp. CCMP2436]